MFLSALKQQNQALLMASLQLWQQGVIRPDTYVLDLDQLLLNAQLLLQQAERLGIKLYAMTKQIGHNPLVCRKLLEMGYQGIVAVDYKEAQQLLQYQIPVAHIGHLVQPPLHSLPALMAGSPEVITVYSLAKVEQIAEVARQLGRVQPLLLKVYQTEDQLYPGQEGGFLLTELPEIVTYIQQLSGVRIVGVTHFPCLMFSPTLQQVVATPNLTTLLQAAATLTQLGVQVEQINGPSVNSYQTLALLSQYGITHAEPGHALTGTLPTNQDGQQPERIAMLYLSEISHHYQQLSYCFGGGYYRRSGLSQALVYHQNQWHQVEVQPVEQSSIDYYLALTGRFPVGSPVVMCFRTQVFVTRSDVAVVAGIQSGGAELVGRYDNLGNVLPALSLE